MITKHRLHTYNTVRCISTSSTSNIRSNFVNYFKDHQHTQVPSASVIPENDNSLMFTNAGMVPLKPMFLGEGNKPFTRATSVQKCIRAGGKHNDLENVGFTPRHHTFFEMLGNFSFGDYFKEEATYFAWNYIRNELQLPSEKLLITYHENDLESRDLWKKITHGIIPEERIVGFGDKDNFWSMGEGKGTPCGPSSEIFFDLGDSLTDFEDRWLEIWNVVFMQYLQNGEGGFIDLPQKCIDTGMGLERISSVMQGVYSNYDIDTIRFLVEAMDMHIKVKLKNPSTEYLLSPPNTLIEPFRQPTKYECALRVLVDHLRSISVMIADGVVPSNVGRGYVLRRIIRRAIGCGYQLGLREPFLHEMVPLLNSSFQLQGASHPYPELMERENVIQNVICSEEEVFFRTISNGMQRLKGHFESQSGEELDPLIVFQMYDTYGFPFDLTAMLAKENGFHVNVSAAENLMDNLQRANQSNESNSCTEVFTPMQIAEKLLNSPEFIGYDRLHEPNATLLAVDGIMMNKDVVRGFCSIDPCPFYAESGGQVGDRGKLRLGQSDIDIRVVNTIKSGKDNVNILEFEVDTSVLPDSIQHSNDLGAVEQFLGFELNGRVDAVVDHEFRKATSIHHTATHLLHTALRTILGEHVMQAGSLVEDNRLRFDFTFGKKLKQKQIDDIESLVNELAEQELRISTDELPMEKAKETGALMLFGEKYGDHVRVVRVTSGHCEKTFVSAELCGGTHCDNTLQVYPFKILNDTSVAAGTRRIEAVAGKSALEWYKKESIIAQKASNALKTSSEQLVSKIEETKTEMKALNKQLQNTQGMVLKLSTEPTSKIISEQGEIWIHEIPNSLVSSKSGEKKKKDDPTTKLLQQKGRMLLEDHPNICHVIVLGERVACTTPGGSIEIHAGKLLGQVVRDLGGNGGGNEKFAVGSIPNCTGTLCDQIVQRVRAILPNCR